MVLLPGCVCCSPTPTCFLSEPYPEYIELDVIFNEASGIGQTTYTWIDTKFYNPGKVLYEERTRTTVHTTALASGAYTIRLTHVGSGVFSSPAGGFLSASVTQQGIVVNVTPAKCTVQASQQINNIFSGNTSTSSTFSDLLRSFTCRFPCFGVTVSPGNTKHVFPQPYDLIGVELGVPNRQFCVGTSFAFNDRIMTVSKSAGAMFPFTVSHGWYGSWADIPYSESAIGYETWGTEASAVVSYGSMSTYPPVPANGSGRIYGFTTSTTLSDIRIKPVDGEPFSIATAFDSSRPSHGSSQRFERANCAEWLLIS